MIPTEAGRAATRLGLFLIVASVLTLPWTDPNSAEFVVLVVTIGTGIAMLVLVAILSRIKR